MREKYETLSLATLKELAKGRGMRGISTLKKGELIEAMLRQDEKDAVNQNAGRHKQRGIALVLIHTSQFPRYTEGRLPSIRLADALAVVNDCV